MNKSLFKRLNTLKNNDSWWIKGNNMQNKRGTDLNNFKKKVKKLDFNNYVYNILFKYLCNSQFL